MPEILPADNETVRRLFRELERSHALVAAFFEGKATARLFVDEVAVPRTGVIVCNSRVLCAGDTTQAGFLDEMERRFSNELIPSHMARGNNVYLVYASGEGWNEVLQQLFSKRDLYHGTRQYYEIVEFTPTHNQLLPNGFSVQPITPEFMSSELAGLDAVRDEMCSERASVEEFLAHSFGICSVYGNEIAGWCMSEYNVGERCEIGIATAPNHQRKGNATVATRIFLAEAYRRGFTHVGWDCLTRNEASAATARKAGFTFVEEYPAVVVEI